MKKYNIVCVVCSKEFRSQHPGGKYCSYDCIYKLQRQKYYEKNPNKKWDDKKRICLICEISYKPTQSNQKYCSKECRKVVMEEQLKATQPYKFRFETLERDEFTCQYCGASPRKNSKVKLHIDHKYPKSKGGKDDKSNLITACEYCNLGKGQMFYPNIFKLDWGN